MQYAVKDIGQALNVDGFKWQEYVIAKMSGMDEALEEHMITELNGLATLEFMAKVFARGRVDRDKGMSEAAVRALANRRVGWGSEALR